MPIFLHQVGYFLGDILDLPWIAMDEHCRLVLDL
jgi:hypothetical protein